MRRSQKPRPLIAMGLILALLTSITGLFGAPGVTVKITSPTSGARVKGVIDVATSVKGVASGGYVICGVDSERPYSSNTPPYTFQIDTRELSDGAHKLFVEVYDSYGLAASSKTVNIYVRNSSAPLVQAKKATATKLAARPKPAEAARAFAATRPSRPDLAASAADSQTEPAVSPLINSPGPMPEPVNTVVLPSPSAARSMVGEMPKYAASYARVTSETPRTQPIKVADGGKGLRAKSPHLVVVDGRPISFDVAPTIRHGRMQVGFRALFEQVGAKVSWHSAKRTAKGIHGSVRIEVPVGSKLVKVNGRQVAMESPATIQASRTVIPLRFAAIVLGSAINWDGKTKVASLETPSRSIAKQMAD